MSTRIAFDSRGCARTAVCGQADRVLECLGRLGTLSPALSINIEEAVEAAWEIAYRAQPAARVIPFRPARR